MIQTSGMVHPHSAAVCLVLVALVPLPATAQIAPLNHDVMLQAKKCLKVTSVLSYGSYRASMVVTFESGAPTDIRTA